MKRLDIKSPDANNFIGVWNINDENLCKNMIDFLSKTKIYKLKAKLLQELMKK